MVQLHKKFTDDQVKSLFKRYLKKEIERKYVQEIMGIGKSRFFTLLKDYRKNPEQFSLQYKRTTKPKLSKIAEKAIIKELKIEKKMIENKDIPIRKYNYSYGKDRLESEYQQKVSLPTIIKRAKNNNFYLPKKQKKATYDREVLTNYIGELIQHDSSYHLWSPAAKEKWYLITSLDDFRRFILYATFLKKETSWSHIQALQTVILKYGCPYSYYVDSIPASVSSRVGTPSGENIINSLMKLLLNGSKSWMIATLKLLTPYPLRLKVKLNALSVGSRIGLLEPMFGKMLKTLEMPKQSLTVRFITIDKLTQSLRKSLTFVFKKLSKKVNLCSVNLKYLFLSNLLKISFALELQELLMPTEEYHSMVCN